MPRMTGGEAVVRALESEGVDVIFGIPGVQIMAVFDSLYRRDKIRLVVPRHEQATTYMACGYARVTGRPGVALVVPGPGVQNASAGLGTAYASSVPVLLLAGQVPTGALGKGTGALHEVDDQLDIVRPVTKWHSRVTAVAEIPAAIREAMRQMRMGRPRPTHVEVLWDVMRGAGDVELADPGAPPAPIPPDWEAVRRAVDILVEARRPIIMAGGGVSISGAAADLQSLASALHAPVLTTREGKGSVPEDDSLCLGATYYAHGAATPAMPGVDVVLAVGTRLTGFMASPGTALRSTHRLVNVNVDAEEFRRNHTPEVSVHADARLALRAIQEELRSRGVTVEERWSREEIQEVRARAWRSLRQRAPLQLDIIAAIRRELDDDAILVAGVTNVAYWANLAFEVREAGAFINSSYFATLGYAFPLALGAKLGDPGRQVVALSGDGGFLYGAMELATAVRYGINVVTLVFRDDAFGASLNDQRLNYAGREIGTSLHNPDFVALAESFGARGFRARGPEGVGAALHEALESGRPAVVEVPIPTLDPPFQVPPSDETHVR